MIDEFNGKYRFLSNFYPVNVVDDAGLEYPSVEHAYQASKTLIREERDSMRFGSAGVVKRLRC